ncbi:hypothetical protein [Pimelobacter sp. 30-1]|uniref:hypothetical protein n=1 Tax=Pimelobacter sp. 30-1 TaxID=2004991 RepID=UPI001C04EABC|nr:hypothetical protein [Pimelobacter sp. 30-1]MBU2697158.1 hypothetical protein [Pimelobacter sp. 30-1]
MNDLDPNLTTALRERLRDERPDLEHLAQSSLRAGVRIRRRRRIGAAAGGVLAVTAIALSASALAGGSTTARNAAVATTPTPSAAATVTAPPGEQDGLEPGALGEPVLPFTLDLPGWTCEYFPVDDKAWCTTAGQNGVTVVARPAAEHADWAGQPDKGADASTLWTSPVHGNYFVTVQGSRADLGATPVATFIDGLRLAPRWDRP